MTRWAPAGTRPPSLSSQRAEAGNWKYAGVSVSALVHRQRVDPETGVVAWSERSRKTWRGGQTMAWLFLLLELICSSSPFHRERWWMNGIIALCGAFLFFLLVTGCVLKIGRDSLCSSVTSTVPNVTRCDRPPKRYFFLNQIVHSKCFNARFSFFSLKSCEEAQNRTWSKPFKGERFYNSLLKAEVNTLLGFEGWASKKKKRN